jgi:hypothetical protein
MEGGEKPRAKYLSETELNYGEVSIKLNGERWNRRKAKIFSGILATYSGGQLQPGLLAEVLDPVL